MTSVHFSPNALHDVDGIFAYIAADSVVHAASVVDEIEAACSRLRIWPYRGRLRPEFGAHTRSLPAGNYVILYRVINPQLVEIVRIIDGRRDLGTVFFSPLLAS